MYYFLPTEKNQINHKAIKHSRGEYVRGDVHTNSVESFWAVLKRSINGTWHHVSPKHLRRYVDEASFRLNDGNCEVDTLDRMAALVRRLTDSRIPLRRYCQVDVERANLSRRADFLCSHRTAQVTSCQTMKARSRSSR